MRETKKGLTDGQKATLKALQKGRTIHRAAKIDQDGNVSALCYRTPRAIPMRRNVSWTVGAETVTCPKCIAIQNQSVSPSGATHE